MTPPYRYPPAEEWGGVLPVAAVLIALALLWVAARFWFPRLKAGANVNPHPIRVLGSRALEPRKVLYVVAVAGELSLVATCENSIQLLHRIDASGFAAWSATAVSARPKEKGETVQ